MRTRSVQYFDAKTGALLARPRMSVTPGMLGPPPMVSRGRRGFGNFPNASGGPGPLVDPYTESQGIFNPGGGPGSGSGTYVGPTADPGATGYLPISAPFGESDRAWSNPTTFATVPISAATNTQQPVLSQNAQRNALIIQNNSSATAPDVAPTLYIGFNAQPNVGFSLALMPGVGVAFDIITPRDSIYVAFGPFINTGSTVVIRGAVIQGTYAP